MGFQRVGRAQFVSPLEALDSLGKSNRPKGQTTGEYVRYLLDRLGVGQELTHIPWGKVKKPIPLPPSSLPAPGG